MKTLGRIILLVVGGLMIYSAIKGLISSIDGIKSLGGWQALLQTLKDASRRGQTLQHLTNLLKSSGLIIVSASAIFAGIKGQGGFWFTIFSVVILGLFIYDVVGKTKAGVFSDKDKWNHIGQLIVDSGTQIGYILGFVFLKLGKDK